MQSTIEHIGEVEPARKLGDPKGNASTTTMELISSRISLLLLLLLWLSLVEIGSALISSRSYNVYDRVSVLLERLLVRTPRHSTD